MTIAARYIASQVLNAILVVLLILLAVDVVAELIDQMGRLRHQFGVVEVLDYIAGTLPTRIVFNLPLASLIGVLVGLGGLANTSELTVLRATGHSIRRLAVYALMPALIVIVGGMAVGEYVAPSMEQRAEAKRYLQRSPPGANIDQGTWLRLQGEYVHVEAVLSVTELAGVTRFIFDDQHRLTETQHADLALYDAQGWSLIDMRGTRIEGEQTTLTDNQRLPWGADLSARLLRLSSVATDRLSMRELYDYAQFLQQQNQANDKYWLGFWRKLLQPLTTIGLVIVAISFVFGSLRQVSMGYRVFTGIIVGIVVQTVQNLLAPASLVYGFSPLVAVLLPTLMCLAMGMYLIRRAG